VRLTESTPAYYDFATGAAGSVRVHAPYTYGAITDVPRAHGLIVSALVGEAMAKQGGFADVFSPDTGRDVVRSPSNEIIGTKSLIQWC
jgi:hypothetical protein